ncbi:MAG: hypothetical protein R2684_04275 [Pyrinomonadaceae bacterium]
MWNSLLFLNLLIGQVPDAIGLLAFGAAMIVFSVVVRRFTEDGSVNAEVENIGKENV